MSSGASWLAAIASAIILVPWHIVKSMQLIWRSNTCRFHLQIEGILPKGPYLPCVSMAGRALLAGYPRKLEVQMSFSDRTSRQCTRIVIPVVATRVRCCIEDSECLLLRRLQSVGSCGRSILWIWSILGVWLWPLLGLGLGLRLNTLRIRQNGSHIADNFFKCIFLNENVCILI